MLYIYIIYIYKYIIYGNQVVAIQHAFFIFKELIKMKNLNHFYLTF